MFFTECARLAERHPDLAAAVQSIDAQLREMGTAEVIRVDDLASFLGMDPNQVSAVLENLAQEGLLLAEEMVECDHCGMAVLRSEYEDLREEDGEYRCTSCDCALADVGTAHTINTYRRGEKWEVEATIAPTPARDVNTEPVIVPALVLDEIKDGETNKALLARIVGCGRFDGVNKKIGSRELFFIYLLFRSTRFHDVAGERMTVITEDEAAQELLKWRDNGYLQFSGKDQDRPAHRIQKMWGEFVRQIEKEKNLKKLFTNDHKDVNGQRLYGLRLRPNEKQILVPSIPALFTKAKT